jgi:thiamine biosynthesis lipoprotein
MPSSAPVERWVARARIALGTLVEIALLANEATEARFDTGFAAIEHVHAKMSAHDPESDLGRIARDAHRRPVVVDPHTFAVLQLAVALWRETRGAFDVTVALGAARGRMSALRLQRDLCVLATVPVSLDLGGIAKGYAVDNTVAALRTAGATAGRVNAGGDLRVFGVGRWMPVRVRDPAAPHFAVQLFDVQGFSVATSADYFESKPALVNPRSRCARPFGGSITVAAPTCAVADALTKIVALEPAQAPAILGRHDADAFRIDGRGDGRCRTTCRGSTAHLRLPQRIAA